MIGLESTGEGGVQSRRKAEFYRRSGIYLHLGDSSKLCASWPAPTVIVVDGPYGLNSFPGDPPTPAGLAAWYRPHIEAWSRQATPQTTLWLWNSELGWANIHPVLAANGWIYRSFHSWDKGLGHVAGNANTKTLRKFPVVTEACVQYVREAFFRQAGQCLTMKDWLRYEWKRSGLPFNEANRACGVKDAAVRKYLTADHLWYYPPVEAFVGLAEYANKHGKPEGRPYFSIDGKRPIPGHEWERMRAKFYCEFGINNVWREPPVNGDERIKSGTRCAHMNQKPVKLLELTIRASSDPGDVVWEPFGGLCSVAVAAWRLKRRCYSAEILPMYFELAKRRLASLEGRKSDAAADSDSARTKLAAP